MTGATRSPRERYREQVRDEVKAHAWAQVATTGASALSINAIAKEMGVSGPALYRYFRNRDELITELVLDAYRDLTTTCRTAVDAVEGTPPARVTAFATALRGWALEAPHRYLLIYGTPVPGYTGPPEATAIAVELMSMLLDAVAGVSSTPGTASATGDIGADAVPRSFASDGGTGAGAVPEAAFAPTPGAERAGGPAVAAFEAHLATHRSWADARHTSPEVLRRALNFWTRVHGVVSLEAAGHFAGMGLDTELLLAAEVEGVLDHGS